MKYAYVLLAVFLTALSLAKANDSAVHDGLAADLTARQAQIDAAISAASK